MNVEIDIFSGRPNPTFELSAEDAKHLLSLLDDLPETPQPPAGEDALGYRGMRVSTTGDPNAPRQIRVSSGVVAIEDASRTRYFRDTRAIEKWLLERAADSGHRTLVESLRR